MSKTRIEKDSLGELEVPADAYYGVQTARALVNFPVSGVRPHKEFVTAFVHIKKAAAIVNNKLGLLDDTKSNAIVQAADEVLDGKMGDQFVVDVYQAGAGTSHNMNTNEVLANRAIEILGGVRGDYAVVHPNDHVNMAQSTNDSFPTAMRLSILTTHRALDASLDTLETSFRKKAVEFDKIPTSSRTHLQDAVPMRLGQQFGGYADVIARARTRLTRATEDLEDLNIGATASGTGMNSHPDYAQAMARQLSAQTDLQLSPAKNFIETCSSLTDFAGYSAALRNLAVDLTKIANDLRLYSSGPTTGLAEFILPPVQPGSSIMPGKVNPVMAECLNMIAYQVIGQDTTVMLAAQAGQFQLNVMMPVAILNILHSMKILRNFLPVFATRCVDGITANEERCRSYYERTLGMATALNPIIGYASAAEVVKEALKTGRTVFELIEEKGIMTADEIQEKFDPMRLSEPGLLKK